PIGSEKQLATEFGVSRITVRKALDVLRADGLLSIERGRGTFVADSPRPVAPTALHLFLDGILARGDSMEVVRDEQTEVSATPEVARALKVGLGTKVVRLRRQMLPSNPEARGTSIWVTYFLTRQIWRQVSPIQGASLLQQIDGTPGLRLAGGHEMIQAIAADGDTATWLHVAPGTAILRREREY